MAVAALLRGPLSPVKMLVRVLPSWDACCHTSAKPFVRPLQIWVPMSHALAAICCWYWLSTPLILPTSPRA